MKKKSLKNVWITASILIIGIIILIIYLLKPWIPSKYRDPLYCDEKVDCTLDANFLGEFSCVNKYHYSGGLDNSWLLSSPDCYCNVSENKCILIPYSPEPYFLRKSLESACTNSGGTVTNITCCKSVSDFPNTCLIGACGCSPDNSHEVEACDCKEGKCWDNSKKECVTSLGIYNQTIGKSTAGFNIKVDSITTEVHPGENYKYLVTLYGVDIDKKMDILINYTIKSVENENLVAASQESMSTESPVSFNRTMKIPYNVNSGIYVIEARVTYDNNLVVSVASFNIT